MSGETRGSPWLTIYVAIVTVLIALPIAIVLIASFTSDPHVGFPPQGFSLRWYTEVFAQEKWLDSLRISLLIGALVAFFATICGVPAALALRTMRGPVAAGLQTFFLSPLMLPTILIGLALLQFYQRIAVPTSVATIVIGHTVIAVPYVVRLVLASFAGIDSNVERAAAILGANPLRAFQRVTFPMIRHGVLAGALFSFIVSLDDVNIALFLSDVHTTPLPVQLFSYIEQNADPLGAAVASLLVLLASIVIFICDRMVGIEWLFGIKQGTRA